MTWTVDNIDNSKRFNNFLFLSNISENIFYYENAFQCVLLNGTIAEQEGNYGV